MRSWNPRTFTKCTAASPFCDVSLEREREMLKETKWDDPRSSGIFSHKNPVQTHHMLLTNSGPAFGRGLQAIRGFMTWIVERVPGQQMVWAASPLKEQPQLRGRVQSTYMATGQVNWRHVDSYLTISWNFYCTNSWELFNGIRGWLIC
jgi:hypothetical protein